MDALLYSRCFTVDTLIYGGFLALPADVLLYSGGLTLEMPYFTVDVLTLQRMPYFTNTLRWILYSE